MRKTPIECTCSSCECGIYTYNDSKVCVACEEGNHNSGSIRLSARRKEQTDDKSLEEKMTGEGTNV